MRVRVVRWNLAAHQSNVLMSLARAHADTEAGRASSQKASAAAAARADDASPRLPSPGIFTLNVHIPDVPPKPSIAATLVVVSLSFDVSEEDVECSALSASFSQTDVCVLLLFVITTQAADAVGNIV